MLINEHTKSRKKRMKEKLLRLPGVLQSLSHSHPRLKILISNLIWTKTRSNGFRKKFLQAMHMTASQELVERNQFVTQ
jgi:hypothetical protein